MQVIRAVRACGLGTPDLRPLKGPKLYSVHRCALAEVIEDVDISCDRRVRTKEASPTCDRFRAGMASFYFIFALCVCVCARERACVLFGSRVQGRFGVAASGLCAWSLYVFTLRLQGPST